MMGHLGLGLVLHLEAVLESIVDPIVCCVSNCYIGKLVIMSIHSDLGDLDVLNHIIVTKDQKIFDNLVFLADDLVVVALDNGIINICANFNLVIVASHCQIVAGISKPF
jgi:hypothetical protein